MSRVSTELPKSAFFRLPNVLQFWAWHCRGLDGSFYSILILFLCFHKHRNMNFYACFWYQWDHSCHNWKRNDLKVSTKSKFQIHFHHLISVQNYEKLSFPFSDQKPFFSDEMWKYCRRRWFLFYFFSFFDEGKFFWWNLFAFFRRAKETFYCKNSDWIFRALLMTEYETKIKRNKPRGRENIKT